MPVADPRVRPDRAVGRSAATSRPVRRRRRRRDAGSPRLGRPGRPLVFLAGSGHSGHLYDDFAPTLTANAHVFAITRRGYGASSQPLTGYDDQRLADDVLAVT